MAELPFDPTKLSPSDRARYERMVERRKAEGAPFGGPYAALMNHPQLCEKVEDLGFYLKFQGHLSREVYQLVVLTVARKTGAEFEWIDHVHHARAAGVPDSVIDALQSAADLTEITLAPYDLAAKILASTLAWKNVPREIQDEAIARFGMEGFVELVVLSGFYQMFSAINQGFDVALPVGAQAPFASKQ
ncbi:carboxymuconolactone decarboxylase family protein [Methylocystis sp. 9N]|uniref:Carboxymuconolactone decarboxylase family protein n=1 Tax=Methylocystis borbori TaxID=3118750 RepID=A0ABU7XH88_9HYPH